MTSKHKTPPKENIETPVRKICLPNLAPKPYIKNLPKNIHHTKENNPSKIVTRKDKERTPQS
jgi:hypothetical protein